MVWCMLISASLSTVPQPPVHLHTIQLMPCRGKNLPDLLDCNYSACTYFALLFTARWNIMLAIDLQPESHVSHALSTVSSMQAL